MQVILSSFQSNHPLSLFIRAFSFLSLINGTKKVNNIRKNFLKFLPAGNYMIEVNNKNNGIRFENVQS